MLDATVLQNKEELELIENLKQEEETQLEQSTPAQDINDTPQ